MTSEASRATRAVRTAIESDTQHGAVVPPLHLSSNYAFAGFGEKREYDYTRSGNPTRDALGEALTTLEGGAGAVVTASGMAALNVLVQLLQPGDLLVVPHDCYGGTYRLYEALGRKGHFEVLFVDQTDDEALARACARKPKMILTETPSNPLLRIVDIAKVAALARECGALYAVDNTFLSPALQQPIALGADIVVHSTTKYINGHSDVVGGAVVSRDAETHERLEWWANCVGSTASPFDCSQVLRGLRTLHLRWRAHQENAADIARMLERHPAVCKTHYPGLGSHPDHALARGQQEGFGAVVSFELAGGDEQVRAFLGGLRHFTLAESLGGVESLVAHPASMTHAAMAPEAQAKAGITPTLLRLSVGIEHCADLVDDVAAGLERVMQVGAGSARLASAG